MPLTPGMDVSKAIHELVHHGRPRPHRQIVAIAEGNKDRKRKAPGLSNPNGVKAAGVKMQPGAKVEHAYGESGGDE